MTTRAPATATRSVSPFVGDVDHAGAALRVEMGEFGEPEQAARRRGDIGLAHQGFADQETARAGRGQAVEIVGAANAALGDDDAVGGHLPRQPFGRAEIDRQGLQIAVVDADQPHAEQQGALELRPIVDFDQHVEPVLGGGGGEFARPRRPTTPP